MIWVKTYVFSTFNKKEDFSRFKLLAERFFFINKNCSPPDSNIRMQTRTGVQSSQILDKKPIVGIFGSKVILTFNI